MNDHCNHRDFSRVSLGIHAEISGPGFAGFQGRVRNVSMSGLFVVGQFKQELVGKPCRVILRLTEEGSGVSIDAQGRVARVNQDGMGIEFIELLGLDSHEHLCNLVRYNAASQIDRVEDELSDHLGLRPY